MTARRRLEQFLERFGGSVAYALDLPGLLDEVEDEARFTSAAAIVRPGDTLLIGLRKELNEEDVERLRETFTQLVGQGIRIGFVDQAHSMTVIRPEGGEGDTQNGS